MSRSKGMSERLTHEHVSLLPGASTKNLMPFLQDLFCAQVTE